jgi:transposase
MITQFYLGIDLHLMNSYMVLMDREGTILDERKLGNNEVKTFLEERVPYETYAVLEATRNWAFMYDMLCEHVHRVALAHPKEVKAISHPAIKTDQLDARTLAHLARLKYLPLAYAASKETRALRLQVRHRQAVIKMSTQTKNRVHAILASYNLKSPVTDLFGVEGQVWLSEHLPELPPASEKAIKDDLKLIADFQQAVTAIEEAFELTPEQKRAYKLLRTIPGVGAVTATIILAEIGDIRRFNSAKALCNWAGLTPKIRNCGEVVRHGIISKEGSNLLRAAIGQAAVNAIRYSPRWRQVHERLLPRCGKKGAKSAVARRLLTVAFCMLTRNQPYQEDYSNDDPAANQGA